MISFELTEDQRLMVESVAQFARSVIRPKVRDAERARAWPEDILKTAHELGLGLAPLPESVGGPGLGMVTAILLEEELAWGDPALPFALGGPGPFGLAVAELAAPEQAHDVLSSFFADGGHDEVGAVLWGERKAHPDRAGHSTVATRQPDGSFKIDGVKSYVANAHRASAFLVFAEVDEAQGWDGLGAFVVSARAPGVSVKDRATTLGLDAACFGTVELSSVVVPESARLLGRGDFKRALLRFFTKNALLIAARAVGLSRAAFEGAREYVDGRRAFGKPIGHFQAVAFTIADRAMDVDASRGLVWRAASRWDRAETEEDERDGMLLSAQAIAFAHEAAMRCGDDGVQLHGGAGFMRDYPAEKLMRDAKQLGLCGMTAEQADQLAAAITLGVPIDLGLVLPTAETQNVFL